MFPADAFTFTWHSKVIYMPSEWLNVEWEFKCPANGFRETLSGLSHSNAF